MTMVPKGIAKNISKLLTKHKEDIDKEVYIEVPDIAWVKMKNLPNNIPRLDQVLLFWDDTNQFSLALAKFALEKKNNYQANIYELAYLVYQHALSLNWAF